MCTVVEGPFGLIELMRSSILSSGRVFGVKCTSMPAKAVFVFELFHCINGAGATLALVEGEALMEEAVMPEVGSGNGAVSIVKVLMI